MNLRDAFPEQLTASMKTRTTARTGALRLIIARLKEVDIEARGRGQPQASDAELLAMLRAMVKSRRDSIALYLQGSRPELAAKEEAEIAVIESFLPQQMNDAALESAISEAIAASGAAGVKDMGKVMAALKGKHAATLDLGRAGPLVRKRLEAGAGG